MNNCIVSQEGLTYRKMRIKRLKWLARSAVGRFNRLLACLTFLNPGLPKRMSPQIDAIPIRVYPPACCRVLPI